MTREEVKESGCWSNEYLRVERAKLETFVAHRSEIIQMHKLCKACIKWKLPFVMGFRSNWIMDAGTVGGLSRSNDRHLTEKYCLLPKQYIETLSN